MALASYYTPTHVLLGKDAYKEVGNELKKVGAKKVLIHYGSDRIKKNGLLNSVINRITKHYPSMYHRWIFLS